MKHTYIITLATLLALLSLGCSTTDGEKYDPAALGYTVCERNRDCQPYGFCNEDGYCASECRDSADCWLFEQQRGGDLVCLNYQCVELNSDGDDDNVDDDNPLDWTCRPKTPEECAAMKWLPFCGDWDCLDHGWQYSCSPTGQCISDESVDFGENQSATTDDYYGVWGTLFTTAARSEGVPLVPYQDTVTIHLLLTRVSRQGDQTVFDSNMCYMEMRNFTADEVFAVGEDIGQLIIPPPYYNNVSSLQHKVEHISPFAPGATFETTVFNEARSVLVDDLTDDDAVPDRDHYNDYCTPWPTSSEECHITDQDDDGKPGMTNIGIGALDNQETYSTQLWHSSLNGTVVDNDHIRGLVPNWNRQYQIGGSNPNMVYDLVVQMHPDVDRSYFRMLRFDEFATCEDVINNYSQEGNWLSFTAHLGEIPDP